MEITTSLLTEEIFRISEIMLQTNNGFKINKTKVLNVLTEATIPGALARAGKKLESVLKGRRFVDSKGQTVVDLEGERLFKSLETKLDNLRLSLNSATVDEGLAILIEKIEKDTAGTAVAERRTLRELITAASQFDMKYAVDLSDGFFTQFLERIKYLKDPVNIGRRIESPPNSGNYIEPQLQARAEYESYFGSNFATSLFNRYVDSGKGLKQKIWEVKYANLNPRDLTIWEKFINSKDKLIPELRITINLYLKALVSRNDNIESVLNDVFMKIKSIETQAQNLGNLEAIPNVQAIYNDIISTFQTVKGPPISLPDVFKEVRDVLITQGLDGGIARKIEEGLKKVVEAQTVPGGPKNSFGAEIPDFLVNTSWAESIRELKRTQGFFGKLDAFTKRQFKFLTFGSIKNMAEWRAFILKSNKNYKGWGVFYGWLYLQVATRIGLPIIVGFFKGLRDTIIALFDPDKKTNFFDAIWDNWGKELKKQWTQITTIPDDVWKGFRNEYHGDHGFAVWSAQLLLPLHNYYSLISDMIYNAGTFLAEGQLSGLMDKIREWLNIRKDNTKDAVATAGNTKPWFRAWCLTNSKSYKGWVDTNPKYGVTTDDKKWKYNESTKGFDEITPTPTEPEETIPSIVGWSADKISFNSFCLATKIKKFREKYGINKEYTFNTWVGQSGTTIETNSMETKDWYWDGKMFKPY